ASGRRRAAPRPGAARPARTGRLVEPRGRGVRARGRRDLRAPAPRMRGHPGTRGDARSPRGRGRAGTRRRRARRALVLPRAPRRHRRGPDRPLPAEGEAVTLAVLHRFAPNRGDGWSWALGHLAELRNFVATRERHEPLEPGRLGELVRDFSAGTVASLRLLGGLTGALHAGLAG